MGFKSRPDHSDLPPMGRFSSAARLLDPLRSERIVPRRGAPVEVQIMGRGRLDVLNARNVSQTGIGVYVPHGFADCDLAQEVELVITLPGEQPFLTRGTIKHRTYGGSEGHHFGVEYKKLSRELRRRIRQYVRGMLPG